MNATALARFWKKVDQSPGQGPHGDCWEWLASCVEAGYGAFWDGERVMGAHVFAYELVHGPVPQGLLVCHVCDNKVCVRDTHLFVGTYADNMHDASQKEAVAKKLTWVKVAEIRTRYAAGGVTQQELADEYGVHQTNISCVVNHQWWRLDKE